MGSVFLHCVHDYKQCSCAGNWCLLRGFASLYQSSVERLNRSVMSSSRESRHVQAPPNGSMAAPVCDALRDVFRCLVERSYAFEFGDFEPVRLVEFWKLSH